MTNSATSRAQPDAIVLSLEPDIAIGPLRIRPSAREVEIADTTVTLEPRVMQVLVALANSPGKVIGRDELVDRCWGGRIVGDDAITRCIGALRKLAHTHGDAFEIETLSKLGYKFVPQHDQTASRSERPEIGSGEVTFTEKPSIAVLPFQNLSGDAAQEYFADGVTEDVITALARFRELVVVSRGSSFAFKGKGLSVRQIAQQLRVRYILSGTVRRANDRIRVTAELTNATTGTQIWTDRYDRNLTDAFDLQDELSRTVAAVVHPAIRGAEIERARRKPPANLSAYDLYLRALPHVWATTRDEMPKAIELLRQSLALDGTSAPALAALAWCLVWASPVGADASLRTRSEALDLARRAVAQDRNDAFAQSVYGITLSMCDEHDLALLHAQEAVRLNPSSAVAWGTMGMVSTWCGDFEASIKILDRALGLGPYDSLLFVWMTWLTAAYFALRRYQDGIEWARRALQHNPNFGTAHRLLAANLALSERLDEARDITRKRDAMQKTTLREIRAMRLFQQDEVLERYLSAQRLVGVAE